MSLNKPNTYQLTHILQKQNPKSMAELVNVRKTKTDARINPENRVANDDYFRAVKENKIMGTLQKKQTEKTMARTRFDDDQTLAACSKKDSLINKSEIEKVELLMAAKQKNRNPNTTKFIDPNLDPKYAISRIQLPPSTMYMIDKVVRQKAA